MIEFDRLIGGHNVELNRDDIINTINYLKGLKNGQEFHSENEYVRKIHHENLLYIRENTK